MQKENFFLEIFLFIQTIRTFTRYKIIEHDLNKITQFIDILMKIFENTNDGGIYFDW